VNLAWFQAMAALIASAGLACRAIARDARSWIPGMSQVRPGFEHAECVVGRTYRDSGPDHDVLADPPLESAADRVGEIDLET